MQLTAVHLALAAALALGACSSDDETEADGGTPSGGTPSGGAGGTPTGGTPSGGAGGEAGGGTGGEAGGGSAGGAEPDAAVPDAAVPDAAIIDCPADVLATAVDVNAHPDGEGFTYAGDTTAAADSTSSPCGGTGSPDVLHRFVAPRAGTWRVDTESTTPKWDTILALRALCLDDAAISCNDDAAFPPLSQATATLEAGEVLYIVVDGHAGGANPDRGAYTLSVTPR